MPVLSDRFVRSFASMKLRDFRYLTLSTASLGFGQWFQQIALGWLVLQITGSPAQMGTITFLRGIMVLVASMPAGVLSDRFSRRNVIVWTTGMGVAQAVVLAGLVLAGIAETWHLYAFGVIGGLTTGIAQPARQAFVYDVVDRERLTNAVTINSLAQNVSRVSGPPLAGVVIGWFGTPSAFFVLAVFNLIAMGFTLMISPRSERPVAKKESALASMRGGLSYAFHNRLILALLLNTVITPVLVLPYVQYLPVFAKDVLHGDAETYGLLASGVGWGSLIGLGVLAWLGDVRRKGLLFVIMQMGYAASVLAFSRADNIVVAMICLVVTGIVFSVMQVMANTLFQLASSSEMRGRVMALYSMNSGFQPLGALPMGISIERWGAPTTVSAYMVIALTLMAGITAFFPELRRAEMTAKDTPQPAKESAVAPSTRPTV